MLPNDPQVMAAVSALGLGAALSFLNWAWLVATWWTGRFHSMIPLVGASFLGAGALLLPTLRPYAWAALLIDVGTLAFLPFIPQIAREIWSTSLFNLLEEYVGNRNITTVHLRLFRKSIFTLWWDIKRLAGEHGITGKGMSGTWEREADTLVLRVGVERVVFRPLLDSSREGWGLSQEFQHEEESPELSLVGLEFVLIVKR
jgi:hypothetical protein